MQPGNIWYRLLETMLIKWVDSLPELLAKARTKLRETKDALAKLPEVREGSIVELVELIGEFFPQRIIKW